MYMMYMYSSIRGMYMMYMYSSTLHVAVFVEVGTTDITFIKIDQILCGTVTEPTDGVIININEWCN